MYHTCIYMYHTCISFFSEMCVYEKSLGNGFQIGMVVWTGKNIILIVIRPFMNIMALSPLYCCMCVHQALYICCYHQTLYEHYTVVVIRPFSLKRMYKYIFNSIIHIASHFRK